MAKYSCPNCGAPLDTEPGPGFVCQYCRAGMDEPVQEHVEKPKPKGELQKPKAQGYDVDRAVYKREMKPWIKRVLIFTAIELLIGLLGGFLYSGDEESGMMIVVAGALFDLGTSLAMGGKRPLKNTAKTLIRPISAVAMIVVLGIVLVIGLAGGMLIHSLIFGN